MCITCGGVAFWVRGSARPGWGRSAWARLRGRRANLPGRLAGPTPVFRPRAGGSGDQGNVVFLILSAKTEPGPERKKFNNGARPGTKKAWSGRGWSGRGGAGPAGERAGAGAGRPGRQSQPERGRSRTGGAGFPVRANAPVARFGVKRYRYCEDILFSRQCFLIGRCPMIDGR